MSEHLLIPMEILPPSAPTQASNGAGRNDTQEKDEIWVREGYTLGKTPTPIYRHAAPSGPWPWMDFDEDVPTVPRGQPTSSDAESWRGYPESSFPNWTESQVKRCEMLSACPVGESTVFKVDVFSDGSFSDKGLKMTKIDSPQSEAAFWHLVNIRREENIRVRALFVKNMTREVLQMLGTRYNIEPFFFSSSTNWIPSRYRESLVHKESDHITVVLPFIRVMDVGTNSSRLQPKVLGSSPSSQKDVQIIDTQSPLYLNSCNKYVLQDLLGVHMVRELEGSTIVSYHPQTRMATAEQLYNLINRTGRSVYWSKIFEKSKDPTCLFLCFLWYAMYEWDEVFEILYAHINYLEQSVLDTGDIRETQNLHILQAHLLYYQTLLEDFRKSVAFVQATANPAMQDPSVENAERVDSEHILKRETDYLLSEIERLEDQRSMQVMRLKNVMHLAFATVNINDSKYTKDLTVATVRDSAAMKLISYLTMVFLPANFMANVFSMNVTEINPSGNQTLAHYAEGAVGLTIFASWLAVALQVESMFFRPGSSVWRRAGWPVFYVWERWLRIYRRRLGGKQKTT